MENTEQQTRLEKLEAFYAAIVNLSKKAKYSNDVAYYVANDYLEDEIANVDPEWYKKQ